MKYCNTFEITVSVKNTGVGDVSAATVTVKILESIELKNIANFSNAVASIVCRLTGSISGQ